MKYSPHLFLVLFLILNLQSQAASPGGLSSDLQLWLKADAGTSTSTDGITITEWSDQSSQGRNATESTNPPIFRDNATDNLNFNPTIDFDGNDDHLDLSLDSLEGTDGFTYFAVGIREDGNSNPILGSSLGRLLYYFGFYDDERFSFTINRSGTNPVLNTIAAHDSPAISPYLGFGYNDSLQLERDSTTFAGSGNNTSMANGNSYYVGRSESNYYLGRISEVIVYDTTLGATDRSKILSYLAIKYGLTLGQNIAQQDYLSSAGTVIWEASTVGTSYDEDIAAIGQDDASELNQTQSKSSNSSAIVTIAENGGGMTDGEFLFWSNNGGSTTLNTTDLPSGISYRLPREWVIEETGEVGAVDLSIDISGLTFPGGTPSQPELVLLVDSDATFASGATSIAASSLSGDIVTFTGVGESVIEDGLFFTLAIEGILPPEITSATYDASTGELVVTGTNFSSTTGATNDVDVTKLSITGEGSNAYTLTTSNVEISNSTTFSVTLNATDSINVNGLLNKNGTTADDLTTYNFAAAEDWMPGAAASDDIADLTGNGITVSNVSVTITSATYDFNTGELVVTGTNFSSTTGASNDVDVTKLSITGEGGNTHQVKIPAQRAGHWFGVYKTPGLSPQRGLSDSVVPTGSVIG